MAGDHGALLWKKVPPSCRRLSMRVHFASRALRPSVTRKDIRVLTFVAISVRNQASRRVQRTDVCSVWNSDSCFPLCLTRNWILFWDTAGGRNFNCGLDWTGLDFNLKIDYFETIIFLYRTPYFSQVFLGTCMSNTFGIFFSCKKQLLFGNLFCCWFVDYCFL